VREGKIMLRTPLIGLLRNLVAVGLLAALVVGIFAGGARLRKASADRREVRFRVLPVHEWGFGRQSATPVPLRPKPLVVSTPTPTPPGIGRLGMRFGGRMRLYRLYLEEGADRRDARLAGRMTGAGGSVAVANRSASGPPMLNLYMPVTAPLPGQPLRMSAGVYAFHSGGLNANAAPSATARAGMYWPFPFPALPGVPGPYPTPAPSPSPTPPAAYVLTGTVGNRRTYTRTIIGANGSRSVHTYTTHAGAPPLSLPPPPPAAPQIPGFHHFPSHSGMVVPEAMLDQLHIEGERLRFGLFEIARLPRVRLERMR
jgi:hypothetical protein